MANSIKLDCFVVKFKAHGKEEYMKFEDLDLWYDPDKNDSKLVQFFRAYIDSFDAQYAVKKSGKAIYIKSEEISFASDQHIIQGVIQGGTTALGSIITGLDDPDAKGEVFHKTPHHVDTIPHHFRLWLPNDLDMGYLIVQAYSTSSISHVLTTHLKRFVSFNKNSPKPVLILNHEINQEWLDEILAYGFPESIKITEHKADNDKIRKLFQAETPTEKVPIELEFKHIKNIPGLTQKIMRRLKGESVTFMDTPLLSEFGISHPSDVTIQIDYNGKKYRAKQSKNYRIDTSVYLDEIEIDRDVNQHPTSESMKRNFDIFLNNFKRKIKYIE